MRCSSLAADRPIPTYPSRPAKSYGVGGHRTSSSSSVMSEPASSVTKHGKAPEEVIHSRDCRNWRRQRCRHGADRGEPACCGISTGHRLEVRQASGGLARCPGSALESRAGEYEQRIEDLELELELAREDRERARDAERQAWAVVSESQQQRGAPPDLPEVANPISVLEALEMAAHQCSNLRFLQSAYESAGASQYSDPALVLSDLLLLNEVATMWVEGTMGADFRTVFQERHNGFRADISTTAATRYAEDYTIRYDGKSELMGPHLRRGVGPPPTILGSTGSRMMRSESWSSAMSDGSYETRATGTESPRLPRRRLAGPPPRWCGHLRVRIPYAAKTPADRAHRGVSALKDRSFFIATDRRSRPVGPSGELIRGRSTCPVMPSAANSANILTSTCSNMSYSMLWISSVAVLLR